MAGLFIEAFGAQQCNKYQNLPCAGAIIQCKLQWRRTQAGHDRCLSHMAKSRFSHV